MIWREARRFCQKNPFLTVSGVAILALGMGVSALALALLMTFSSLVYPGIKSMGHATIAEQTQDGGSFPIAWNQFERIGQFAASYARLAAYSREISSEVLIGGHRESMSVAAISKQFFTVFTGRLAAGRDFDATEEDQSGRHVAILSYRLAATMFGTYSQAVGRSLTIAGLPYEIVGVAPRSFGGMFGEHVEVWVPLSAIVPLLLDGFSSGSSDRTAWKAIAAFYVLAISEHSTSQALTQRLAGSLQLVKHGEVPLHVSVGLTTDPVRDEKYRKRLRLGLALCVTFTFVSSLNFALLLLTRTSRYAEQIRLKRILGASGSRLAAESIAGPAALVGMGLFCAGIFLLFGIALITRMPGFYGQVGQGAWGTALSAFSFQLPLALVLTGVISLLPMLSLARENVSQSAGYTKTASRRTNILMQVPVILQIALTMGTWLLAGMVIASLIKEMAEPLGYDPNRLQVVRMGPSSGSLTISVAGNGVSPMTLSLASLIHLTETIPGVYSAAYTSATPFEREKGAPPAIERIDRATVSVPRTVREYLVSPEFFRTMGARFLAGRNFPPHGGSSEIVINETLARELWPNQDPVNRPVKLIFPAFSGLPSHVKSAIAVGVVQDLRSPERARTALPSIYRSFYSTGLMDFTPNLVVRGSISPSAFKTALGPQVTTQLSGMSIQSIYDVGEMTKAIFRKEAQRSYVALTGAIMMAIVSYVALYASLTYFVATRRRELAIRICVGAPPSSIRKIIVYRAVSSVLIALILSAPLWLILARHLSTELLGDLVWSTDRAIALSAACIVLSILIALIPARTAALVSPSEVLKEK